LCVSERINSIDAKKSHIVHTQGQPVLKTFYKYYKNKLWFWLSVNIEQGYSYILEVPEDTVKYDYVIDLQ